MNHKRYVICDIEATGLHDDRDLIEIALLTFEDGKVKEIYETLINPEIPVSPRVVELTGISPRMLEEAPKFHEVAESIRLRLENSVFVSHNTDFDLGLLRKRFTERGEELKTKPLCTLKLATELIPGLSNYNLDALAAFFGIRIRDRHRALGDAEATLAIFRELQTLRQNVQTRPRWLPQHERLFKNLPRRPGILSFLNPRGEVLRTEVTSDPEKRARELLSVRPENRKLFREVASVEATLTGSVLIGEIERTLKNPPRYHWLVELEPQERGELRFVTSPYRKGSTGIWFFTHHREALKKCRDLNQRIEGRKLIHEEGGKSKEEILRKNQRALEISRRELFPTPHLVVLGEGRNLGERSLVLIRDEHFLGYGFTEAREEDILKDPDSHITRTLKPSPALDLVARRYLRELKNLRQKTERWQGLSARSMLNLSL